MMAARRGSWRTLSLAGGVLYLMTFVFSIPAVFLLEPILSNPNYIVSTGADSQVLLGTLFDLITALACIGTAVALFPVIRRQSEAASLGFVTTRIFEAAVIVIGVVSILAVVAMRQDEQVSVWSGIAVVPIFLWELALGLWLTFKGFSPSAAAALGAGPDQLAPQVPPQRVVAPKSAGA